jgi:hypothetical protein
MFNMRFNKTIPCKSCPFRKRGKLAVRLTIPRVKQIAGMMLKHGGGGTFSCHEDLYERMEKSKKGKKGRGRRVPVHCAGALHFAEKNNCQTQPMQLAERAGHIWPDWPLTHRYHPEKFQNPRLWRLVFDTIEEMLATAFRR